MSQDRPKYHPENYDELTLKVSLDGPIPRYQARRIPILPIRDYKYIPFIDSEKNPIQPTSISLIDTYEAADVYATLDITGFKKKQPGYELEVYRDPANPTEITHFYYNPKSGIKPSSFLNKRGLEIRSNRLTSVVQYVTEHYPQLVVTSSSLTLWSGLQRLLNITPAGLEANPDIFKSSALDTQGEWQTQNKGYRLRSNLNKPPYSFETDIEGIIFDYTDEERKRFEDFSEDTRPIPEALKMRVGVTMNSLDINEIAYQIKHTIDAKNVSAKSIAAIVEARHAILWKFYSK